VGFRAERVTFPAVDGRELVGGTAPAASCTAVVAVSIAANTAGARASRAAPGAVGTTAPAPALEEEAPELGLEPLDGDAQRLLGEVQSRDGAREAALLGHRLEPALARRLRVVPRVTSVRLCTDTAPLFAGATMG